MVTQKLSYKHHGQEKRETEGSVECKHTGHVGGGVMGNVVACRDDVEENVICNTMRGRSILDLAGMRSVQQVAVYPPTQLSLVSSATAKP